MLTQYRSDLNLFECRQIIAGIITSMIPTWHKPVVSQQRFHGKQNPKFGIHAFPFV